MLITILNMSMFALFGWFISHYAKNNMPRLIWSGIGIYIIIGAVESGSVFFNLTTYFGLGLILPHLIFLYEWIKSVINTLKLITFDIYYFFITAYYKTRNTFYWFISFYEKIQSFFYEKKNKKAYEKFYKDDGYKYEEPKREQKQEKTYKQKENTQSNETKKDYGIYGRFNESDPYVVLGVSRSDNLKTIKKEYRRLINEYHSDRHYDKSPEDLKKYTEISQLINNAWDIVKQQKK